MGELKIIKRDGRIENFSPSKIVTRIKNQSKNLSVSPDYIFLDVTRLIIDNIHSADIDELIVKVSSAKKVEHPDYGKLATRVAITRLHKECNLSLVEIAERSLNADKKAGLSKEYLEKVKKYGNVLDEILNHELDFNYDIFGLSTLLDRYLLRHENKVIERPQQMYMRIALVVSDDNLKSITETYNLLSQGLYSHATPTMLNAGRKCQQLSSCFLLQTGDSLEQLMDDLKDMATLSKYAGGIGVDVTPVRASGSNVAGLGESQGLMPLFKVYEYTARWFNQLGMRKGAFAVYLEPWHKDFFIFTELRKNNGKDEVRARDLFTGVWASNYFFECVKANDDWFLFCPNEVYEATGIKLNELYADEFKSVYIGLSQNENVSKVKVKAQDVWLKIIDSQIETGMPYILNKDEANLKTNQKNAGVIHSSNLCAEVLQVTSADEIANCNLSSICLPKFVVDGEIDYKMLYEITKKVVYNTNNVIDVNFYAVERTAYSNSRLRPMGVGVQGLADVFAVLKVPYESKEAKEINKKIFETIYFAALESSMEMAKQHGPYEMYDGSPVSKGILQYHEWGLQEENLSGLWDWSLLIDKIKTYGVRNSLLIALMPTASTSQIMNNNEMFEPFTSNIYARKTLSGTFEVINKHLVADLLELGLWDKNTWKIIVANKGSINYVNPDLDGEDLLVVQDFLNKIPQNIKDTYKIVWEMSMKNIIDMAADRAPFIDQTQSMNLFVSEPNIGKISSMLMYAASKKLKTLIYYLRTRTKAEVDKNLGFRLSEIKSLPSKPDNSMFECLGCSA